MDEEAILAEADALLAEYGRHRAARDKTAVEPKPGKTGRRGGSLAFPLNEILRDYIGAQWWEPLPLMGGAVDLGLTIGSVNPVVRRAKEATVLLNDAPKYLTQDDDYWKNMGKRDRAYRNDQMNKLKTDLRSVFINPPIDY